MPRLMPLDIYAFDILPLMAMPLRCCHTPDTRRQTLSMPMLPLMFRFLISSDAFFLLMIIFFLMPY